MFRYVLGMLNFDFFRSPISFNILFAMLYLMMKCFDEIFGCREKLNRMINVIVYRHISILFIRMSIQIYVVCVVFCLYFIVFIVLYCVVLCCIVLYSVV